MSKDKMSTDRQEIARKIRDGSYFSDASNWYGIKYLYPITDRSMAFLFAMATVFAVIPMIFLLKTTVESNEKLAFPIYAEDSTSHASVMRPLAKPDETAQEAIARYLISDYIISREQYIAAEMTSERVRRLLKKIKSSSSKQTLNEYSAYISESNVRSPLIVYKDHTNRFIDIKSLSFLDNDQTSGKAKVVFESREEKKGVPTKTRQWETFINFRLPDVETIAKTGAPLRFLVNYYRTKPIGEAKQAAPAPAKKAEPVENKEPKNETQSQPDNQTTQGQ